MSFKKIYNEYIKQPNTENENLLLREICYNINFFVGYIEENEKYRKEQNKMNLMSAKLDGLNQIFELLGSLVFIALGLVFVSQGITTVDRLAAVYLLYGSMSWNL